MEIFRGRIRLDLFTAVTIAGLLQFLVIAQATEMEDKYLIAFGLVLWGVIAYLIYAILSRTTIRSWSTGRSMINIGPSYRRFFLGVSVLLLVLSILLSESLGGHLGLPVHAGIPFNASMFILVIGLVLLGLTLPGATGGRPDSIAIASFLLGTAALLPLAASFGALLNSGFSMQTYFNLMRIAFTLSVAALILFLLKQGKVEEKDKREISNSGSNIH